MSRPRASRLLKNLRDERIVTAVGAPVEDRALALPREGAVRGELALDAAQDRRGELLLVRGALEELLLRGV